MDAVDQVTLMGGKYRLLAELGQGGMAKVYLAVAHGPSGFSKLVVLKVLRMHLLEDEDAQRMFLDEARLAGRLNHPNVVHTLEVIEDQGQHVMVMEYLDGQSVSASLRRSRKLGQKLPLSYELRTISDALSGLHYAHELRDFDGTPLGIIHRDVSPQNIFITYDGQVKLVDFGIAKAITSTAETKAGALKGKVPYMSPEQFLGDHIDRRVDIYAMGAILWRAATGKRLWRGVSEVQVIRKVISGEIPRAKDVNPDVHPELDRICAKAMSVEADERYATALEMQDDLERFMEDLGEKVSTRKLGLKLSALFADVRKEINQVIELQLSRAQTASSADYAREQLPAILSTTRTAGVFMPSSSGSNGLPALHSGQFALSDSGGSDPHVASYSSGQMGSVAASLSPPAGLSTPPPERRIRPLAIVLIMLAIGAISMAGVLWKRSGERQARTQRVASVSPSVSQQPDSPRAPSASPTASSVVHIKIMVHPSEAAIFVDGRKMAGNPTEVSFEGDGKDHAVRMVAEGYKERLDTIKAKSDMLLEVQLQPKAKSYRTGPRHHVAGRHASTPATTAAPAKTTASAKPQRPLPPKHTTHPSKTDSKDNARDRIKHLDTSNPWN